MSSRLHNKYHRHNHHSVAVKDNRYPDASHDPIASFDSPFLGPFVLIGPLSATTIIPENFPDSDFGITQRPAGVFIVPETSATAVQVEGSVTVTGTISANGTLSVPDIVFTGDVLSTYQTPVTATGEFLVVNVNGLNRAIRLWQYE
jgi:hypothetical protein